MNLGYINSIIIIIKDISPRRRFAPWAFCTMDVSPQRRFTPEITRPKTIGPTDTVNITTMLCQKGLSDVFGHFVLFTDYDITANKIF